MATTVPYWVFSWAIAIALGTAATYHYRPDLFQGLFPQKQPILQSVPADNKVKKKTKSKVFGTNAPIVQGEDNVTGKRKRPSQVIGDVTAPSRKGENVKLPQPNEKSGDGDMGDNDSLTRLVEAQVGTPQESTSKPATKAGRTKPKQNQARTSSQPAKATTTIDSPTRSTATSSTTGADGANEPMAGSPQSSQIPTAATSRAGDISDMLESERPGPSVLSIKVDADAMAKQMAQAAKKNEFQQVVPKKNNRKERLKTERAEAVQQSLAEHEAKKQQQMRTARMAEGTSKQTRANSFKPPTQNVWQVGAGPTKENAPDQASVNGAPQLLDTIETNDGIQVTPTKVAVSARPFEYVTNLPKSSNSTKGDKALLSQNGASALRASGRDRLTQDKPSKTSWAEEMNDADDVHDEDFLRILREQQQEDAWQSVISKKGKKKTGKAEGDTSSEASSGALRSTGTTVKAATNGVASRPDISQNRFASFVNTQEQSP